MDNEDELIGELVHRALWRARKSQTDLARTLGVDQGSVSRRLRGRIAWRVSDVKAAAALCGVDWRDLIPDTPAAATSADGADIGCSLPRGRRLRLVPDDVADLRGRMPLNVVVSPAHTALRA